MSNALYESEIEQIAIASIRKVLLPKLMNGEICVTEQQILTEVQSAD